MIRFGTGGWRAVIGDDFIKENVQRVAQGICLLARKEKKTDRPIYIGYDRRFLSDMASRWIAEVLCANGIEVLFVGRSTPTPLVMFEVMNRRLHYGIEVTASHNPASYNGIKLIVEEGRDAPVECTAELEALIEGIEEIPTLPFDNAVERGFAKEVQTPFNDFLDSILSRLDLQVIRNRGLRILFDPMHGSGTYPLTVVLNTARCTVDTIHHNKDAYFGGELPAPGKRQLRGLADEVRNGGYDLGLAFDGDGDRLGVIDRSGEYIDANKILVMLYYYLHEFRGWKGPVVRNNATTHMLDRVAESFGERCYEVPVGFKYISAKIDETDAVLGGESSGGLTVRGHIHGKDSVYAASLFVEMISAMDCSPSKLWADLTAKYGAHTMEEDNLSFAPDDRTRVHDVLMTERKLPNFGRAIADVDYTDGCRINFADGAFLICRFSGTEPLLRIFAEDKTSAGARALIDTMRSFLNL